MLSAITQDGKKVYADEVFREDGDQYFCPGCGSELVLRQGTKNIWHFAHKFGHDESCLYKKYENESKQHRLMKKTIKKIIEKDNKCLKSELEYQIGSKIADYYFEVRSKWGTRRKIAVECVHKHTNIDVFREKNEYYAKKGIFVIWLFSASRLGYYEDDFDFEVRINEIIKESHTMYFGKVYVINTDDEVIYGIHLESVYRIYNNGSGRWLKRTKEVIPKYISKFNINYFVKSFSDDYLPYNRNPANVPLKKWW